jgi:hypothetical protein
MRCRCFYGIIGGKNKLIKYRSKISVVIAFVLVLTIAASAVCLPTFAVVNTNVPTNCWLSLRPNPIGVGQELLINGWRSPTPYGYQTVNMTPPPGVSITDGVPFDFRLVITKPDGSKLDLYPIKSDGPGTFWLTYVVDQKGTWTFELSTQADQWFQGSSVTQTLVVQDEPIPSWPAAELPEDEPWYWPINPENREWASISGGWFQPKYDASASNYNPYSRGPNSAHILWKLQPTGAAGLIGGQYGQLETFSASRQAITVVMNGRGYYTAAGNITCVDIRTGEILWSKPGSFTLGTIRSGTPVLYEFTNDRFRVYNGITGEKTLDVQGMRPLGGTQGIGIAFQDPYVYSAQLTSVPGQEYVIKWTTEGNAANFSDRIIWNVSSPFKPEDPHYQSTQTYGMTLYGDMYFQLGWPYYAESGAMNLTTGEALWTYTLTPDIAWITSRGALGATNGLAVCPIVLPDACKLAAWDMKTGEIAWISESTADPWGGFWSYQYATAYDLIYKLTYAGVYAFNATNGKIVWYYSAGDAGMETPYAIQAPGDSGLETTQTTWPFGSNEAVVADGKVYAPSSEHSPTLYYRGTRLHCIDAFTGDSVWTIMGYYTVHAVAEDTLFASNQYDGCAYAFAKGTTETTISVSSEVIPKGSEILIKGTVMDMSPAQPNTPAVSEDSMSAWMEYLHMQQPKPSDTTGVTVKLTAIDSSGHSIDIGTVTSDDSGLFKKLWSPPAEGEYTIVATFEGSNSYYASSAKTAIGVSAAQASVIITPEPTQTVAPTSPVQTTSPAVTSSVPASPTVAPEPGSESSLSAYIAVAAVAIIAAVVVVALLLKRRVK